MDKITTLAEQLSALRTEVNKVEEEFEVKMSPLKIERDAIQTALIGALEEAKLKSIKVESGENYALSIRKGINITLEGHALEWAKENGAVAIDKKLVSQKLQNADILPAGFERTETKFISIRKN